VAIGEWSEAALVSFLFGLGTTLQAATLERTRRAIGALMELAPDEAVVLRGGEERRVPSGDVAVGEIILVRPGERVPLDGTVAEGEAAVEPVAGHRRIGAGDAATRRHGLRRLDRRGRIAAAADDRAGRRHDRRPHRPPGRGGAGPACARPGTVDRFAARYTPAVVALAVAVALLPPLLGAPFSEWLYRGLALLIVSCPCALVISTPVSILAALRRATRLGALIKGGASLEQAATLRAVAIDKTGTLTRGRPQVTEVVPLNGASPERVLAVAAACEHLSEHALARAIVAAARERGIALPQATGFRAVAGLGVLAELDGRACAVGRPELLGAAGADPQLRAALADAESRGATAVAVADEHGPLGVLAVSDPVRDEAAGAVARLHELGLAPVVMLTGDNPDAARAVAAQTGVDEVAAGLLPADKIDAVRRLRASHGDVAMVGDGVNDAPALAAATLGVAMGAAGTDAALQTADVALMGDDLSTLPEIVALARRTRRIIRQNIVLSIAIKAVFLVLAPLGLTTLWLAVFADMGTSLLVTANGLRLARR
jgi:Zn2+/Cd2+-exporting ATPase